MEENMLNHDICEYCLIGRHEYCTEQIQHLNGADTDCECSICIDKVQKGVMK